MEVKKVVVLQDNSESIDYIKSAICEIDGFAVEGTSVDGEEGLKLVTEINPDFLVLGTVTIMESNLVSNSIFNGNHHI